MKKSLVDEILYITPIQSLFALAIYNGTIRAIWKTDIQSENLTLIGNIMNDISVCVRLLI